MNVYKIGNFLNWTFKLKCTQQCVTTMFEFKLNRADKEQCSFQENDYNVMSYIISLIFGKIYSFKILVELATVLEAAI